MKVWVVERHTDYESSEVIAVFNEKLSIEDIKGRFPAVKWDELESTVPDGSTDYAAWRSHWSSDNLLIPFYDYGFDTLSFELIDVQE